MKQFSVFLKLKLTGFGKSIRMGVRLSHCSSLQISCYQKAEVTWINKGGDRLSGRVKSCSQLGTVNSLLPLRLRGRVRGGPLCSLLAQHLLAHHSQSLWGRARPGRREWGAPRVCESQCLLMFCTLGTSGGLFWPCAGDSLPSLPQILEFDPEDGAK